MNTKKITKVTSLTLGTILCTASLSTLFASCGKKDALVIMTEELNGLFNPFYATTGTDQDVVGMTQISMLTTDHSGSITCGKNEATAVLDYDITPSGDNTVYTFVIKNDLKYSDGKALTMNDVLFNMYEYLDPVYTGSSTMYSTDIIGLQQYRTQQNLSGTTSAEDNISSQALTSARNRIQELINVYTTAGRTSPSATTYSADEAKMKDAIAAWSVTPSYKNAIASKSEQAKMTDADWKKQLQKDYDYTLESFKKELETDYSSAKEAFDVTAAPYKDHEEFKNEVFCFLYYEGYVEVEYNKINGKDDKTSIKSLNYNKTITTKEAALNYVYADQVETQLRSILQYWGTANTLQTEYAAKAKQVILHESVGDELAYKSISGIKSLGHEVEKKESNLTSVKVNGTDYALATTHNADGTPTDSSAYDVLQITVKGNDPKAIYNFAFAVAPEHYYADDEAQAKVDILNDKFGVEWGSFDFQKDVIQSQQHLSIPVGAGPYKATDENNSDTPARTDFYIKNMVHFKANDNFMFDVQTKKIRYQVVSSSDALDVLTSGAVDYVTPQFTRENAQSLDALKKKGYNSLDTWQLGYGYIGINAGKVPNRYLRYAIMSAMDTSLALQYYNTGTAKNIDWPMSMVSWAYPFEDDGVTSKSNNHSYTQWTGEAAAKEKIENYMKLAGANAGDSRLTLKFTIAGSNLTEHPTYNSFKYAAEILNSCGWNVEVIADTQALTKLSTGSLAVWAAAWGATIDPDMYQVYHKNSTATSIYAWGYREMLADTATYRYENDIINKLSDVIDRAREITDQTARTAMYEQAMGYVLDLGVELPVYQRKTLYAYNANVIDSTSMPSEVNPYSSPLERIWDVKMK